MTPPIVTLPWPGAQDRPLVEFQPRLPLMEPVPELGPLCEIVIMNVDPARRFPPEHTIQPQAIEKSPRTTSLGKIPVALVTPAHVSKKPPNEQLDEPQEPPLKLPEVEKVTDCAAAGADAKLSVATPINADRAKLRTPILPPDSDSSRSSASTNEPSVSRAEHGSYQSQQSGVLAFQTIVTQRIRLDTQPGLQKNVRGQCCYSTADRVVPMQQRNASGYEAQPTVEPQRNDVSTYRP